MTSKVIDAKAVSSILRLRIVRAEAAMVRTRPAADQSGTVDYTEHFEMTWQCKAARDIAIEISELLPASEREAFLLSSGVTRD